MSPVELHGGEVRYYSSPIMVKTQQYTATLTSERLIIEGGSAPREFKVTNIVTAEKTALDNGEPALKIILSTPNGQKEMIWGFPVGEVFKPGEQQAWIDNIQKVHGEKPFTVPATKSASPRATAGAAPQPPKAPAYSPGEMEILQTAGVRIKRTYYTLYLTNLRLILQNSNGQIGREFAIAELMDAGKMEGESGEPSIALTVGSQAGVKQMILTFPSAGAREAWMTQISAKLPSQVVQMPPQQMGQPGMMPPPMGYPMGGAPQQPSMLTLQPGERTILSSPGIRIKRDVYTAYLTNTRFVLMGNSYGMLSIAGEFAIGTLRKAARMASELSEPGIALKMRGPEGEKEMHLIFPSMELREMWLDQLAALIPKEQPPAFTPPQYSTTTVTPPAATGGGGSGQKFCTVCGTRNHSDDKFCGMCGKPLDSSQAESAGAYGSAGGYDGYDEPPRQRREKRSKPDRRRKPARDEYDAGMPERPRGKKQRPPKRRREPKQKMQRQYEGGILGFLLHPADAYAYYRQESPGEAILTFLISGVVWAAVSVLLLAYAVPKLLNISVNEFPIIGGLQGNIMAIVMLIVMMLLLWVIFLVIQAVLTAIFSKVFGENASIGEVLAVVMRSTLPYAAIGWLPGFGVIIAALWSTFNTSKGLEFSLDMRGGSAIGAALIGFVVVALIIVAMGLV